MALYESILQLKTLDECCAFFDDLCTVGELRALEQRYRRGHSFGPGTGLH